MILIINNSNRNNDIKKFVEKHNSTHSYKKKGSFKKKSKKIKQKKQKNTTSKTKKLNVRYLTDKLINLMKTLNINIKNIITTSDLIDVIDSKEKVNGIIISGSDMRFSFKDIPPHIIAHNIFSIEYFKDVPVFGICFGFQFLNYYYNGVIVSQSGYSNKKHKVQVNTPGWFFKKEHSGEFNFYNRDVVINTGEHLNSIANLENDGVDVSVIIESNRNQRKFIGTQFHPEISGYNGMKIFKDFIELCGENYNEIL